MCKKVTLVTFLLSAILCISHECYADPAGQLEQFASYKWYPAQVESIHQQVSAAYPGTESALKAHSNLVISYILAKRDGDAQSSLNQLSTDFSGHSGLPATLYEVARVYERCRKYTEAQGIYKQIKQQHPNSPEVVKVQLSERRMEVLGHIDTESNGVAAAIEQLIADFGDHSELPATLYDIARKYERAKKLKEAEGLYQRIIRHYPAGPAVSDARLGIVKVNIYRLVKSGGIGIAQAAVNSLVTAFAGHPRLPETLYDVAIRYERAKATDRARSLYEQIGQQFPGGSHSCRAQIDILKLDICSMIDAGTLEAAQTAVDALVSTFSGHTYLPSVLYPVARRFQDLGLFEQAKGIYQQIVRICGDSLQAGRARLDIHKCGILSHIVAGKDQEAQSRIEELIAGHLDHPYLPWVLCQLGQEYEKLFTELAGGEVCGVSEPALRKAIAIYERIVQQLPESSAVPVACSAISNCYNRLSDYTKSNSYYQRVIDEYSGSLKADHAQFMVGFNHEKMLKQGLISRVDAEQHIRSAYQQYIEKYPDSQAARHVRDWLNYKD